MTFTVEIVPRGRNDATTERVTVDCRDVAAWTDEDVEAMLKGILQAIDRVANPSAGERPVFLRGFSWIVEPSAGHVVVALEIEGGAAVAGPFAIDAGRLDQMIARVVQASRLPSPGTRPQVH